MTNETTSETRPELRVVGSLRSINGRGVVRVEDVYATDIDDLWSAVTDPGRLARWIAEVEGDLHVGGRFHARFTSGWEGSGRVDVCESPRRLLLTLSPGSADETVIEALLATEGDRTRLVIEERFLPLDELAAHGAGWQAHIEDLTSHVTGNDSIGWRDRWVQLTPSYRALAERLT